MTEDITTIVSDLVQQLTWQPSPFFISGTRLSTNAEWTKATTNLAEKLPLIWLLETINEKFYGKESVYERTSDLRLFFLEDTDIRQYLNADHRSNVVYPMYQLAMEFVDVIENDTTIVPLEDWQIKTFTRFGVEQQNGVVQNILDANLSGVELQLSITRYKKQNCGY